MLDRQRQLLVLQPRVGEVAGEAVVFRERVGVAEVFVFLLDLVLLVVEDRVAGLEAGLAAEHLAGELAVQRPVVGGDVDIVVVGDREIPIADIAVLVLPGVLVGEPVGAHEQTRQLQVPAADLNLIGGVEGVVGAVAGVGLHLDVVEGAARLVIAPARLLLGIAASLDAGADQQPARSGLTGPDAAEGLAHPPVVEQDGAGAQIAAVQGLAVAQHDVQGAGHGVAAAVGAGRAHDLDALDQLGRDAVDEERAVKAGAGHPLAVDQDLGVAGVQAAQPRAVALQHVGQEGDAGHALHGVAGGQRLEPPVTISSETGVASAASSARAGVASTSGAIAAQASSESRVMGSPDKRGG